MTGYDWDALAPHWHLFEQAGTNLRDIDAVIADGASAPAVVVGAGLGTFSAALAQRVHGVAIGVDKSIAMARRCHALHPESPIVVADVVALPFASGTFATVVCTTGVLEQAGCALPAKLVELARVASNGRVYVNSFVRDRWAVDMHMLADAWYSGRGHDPTLNALAAELGDRSAAVALVKRAFPQFPQGLDERELCDAAAAAKLSVRRLRGATEDQTMLWRLE